MYIVSKKQMILTCTISYLMIHTDTIILKLLILCYVIILLDCFNIIYYDAIIEI